MTGAVRVVLHGDVLPKGRDIPGTLTDGFGHRIPPDAKRTSACNSSAAVPTVNEVESRRGR